MTRNLEPRQVGTAEFMSLFGFRSRPDLYRKANGGLIPGAVKQFGRWKFDVATYEASTKQAAKDAPVTAPEPGRRITAKPGRRKS